MADPPRPKKGAAPVGPLDPPPRRGPLGGPTLQPHPDDAEPPDDDPALSEGERVENWRPVAGPSIGPPMLPPDHLDRDELDQDREPRFARPNKDDEWIAENWFIRKEDQQPDEDYGDAVFVRESWIPRLKLPELKDDPVITGSKLGDMAVGAGLAGCVAVCALLLLAFTLISGIAVGACVGMYEKQHPGEIEKIFREFTTPASPTPVDGASSNPSSTPPIPDDVASEQQ